MSHTPGPWEYDTRGSVLGPQHRHPQSVTLGVEMKSRPTVCFVRGYSGSVEAEANGKLIAAAPDMAKVLHAIITGYGQGRVKMLDIKEARHLLKQAGVIE